MKISRKQLTFFTAVARAHNLDESTPYTHFSYVDAGGHYSGPDITDNEKVLSQLSKQGIIRLTGDEDDFTVELVNRSDFLTGWSDGVRAAERGEGTEYSAYCSMPIAFVAGHQHWHEHNRPGQIPYKDEYQRRCHGFISADTGERWLQ